MKIDANVSYLIVEIIMVLTMVVCISAVVSKVTGVQMGAVPNFLFWAIVLVVGYSAIEENRK